MPRVRADNDARYALRASFVDTDGNVLDGPIVIGGDANDPRISDTDIANWDTAYGWGDHASAGYYINGSSTLSATSLIKCGTDGSSPIGFTVNDGGGNGNIVWNHFNNATTTAGANTARIVHNSDSTTDSNLSIRVGSGGAAPTESLRVDAAGIDINGSATFYDTDTNQIYFNFVGGAVKRLTTQGGLIIGVDSTVVLHAGDQVNSMKGTLGLTDATTLEDLFLTADGSVHVQSGHQTAGGSTAYTFKFTNAGQLLMPHGSGLSPTTTILKAGTLGQYGSVYVDGGAVGGYEGYSIGGRAVFMHNNNTTTGIYNDVNNHWLFQAIHNGESRMYHAGVKKGYTYGSGYRVTGNLLATSDVYAYYSDERLKDVVGAIEKPLESIEAIETFYYTHNDKARELGYEGSERQVGVSAQSVQAVLPEVIGRAPIDDDGEGGSVTGEDYMTVKYERIVPLLIEGIKELTSELESVKIELQELKDRTNAV